MKTKLLSRLISAVCMAFIMVLLVTVVQAQENPTPTPKPTECNACHESLVTHWQESAHGRATTDPVFEEALQEQGSPEECLPCHTTGFDATTGTWDEDGVACATCHYLGENSPAHPDMVMLTDNSSRACGACHIDTHSEWQDSVHGQGELTCIRCHNPHTTDIKSDTVQELCANCHPTETHQYDYTGHAQEGLLCTDCHLRISESALGEGHGKREHTFAVDLQTCNDCHESDMHARTNMSMTTTLGIDNELPTAPSSVEGASNGGLLSSLPGSANTLNTLAAAGIGLAIGFIMAPVADRWYRRFAIR